MIVVSIAYLTISMLLYKSGQLLHYLFRFLYYLKIWIL